MDFDPKEMVLSFQVPEVCDKFRRNWFKIAIVRARTHRQTHTHTHTRTHIQIHTYTHRDHTSDLIICPMLCYSNGTDNEITRACS